MELWIPDLKCNKDLRVMDTNGKLATTATKGNNSLFFFFCFSVHQANLEMVSTLKGKTLLLKSQLLPRETKIISTDLLPLQVYAFLLNRFKSFRQSSRSSYILNLKPKECNTAMQVA